MVKHDNRGNHWDHVLVKKATIQQVATMVATSKKYPILLEEKSLTALLFHII